MPNCPTCRRPIEWQDNPWRPFCSERCKLIDFDKWTSEEYRVPGQHISPAEAAQDSDRPAESENSNEQ